MLLLLLLLFLPQGFGGFLKHVLPFVEIGLSHTAHALFLRLLLFLLSVERVHSTVVAPTVGLQKWVGHAVVLKRVVVSLVFFPTTALRRLVRPVRPGTAQERV